MRSSFSKTVLAFSIVAGVGASARADDYVIDAAHSGISFQISHLGLSYVQGRFDEFSGNFKLDSSDPAKSSFTLSIKAESIDTNNPGATNISRAPTSSTSSSFRRSASPARP